VLISDTNFTALAFSLISTPRNLVQALQDSEGIFQIMNTDKLKIIFFKSPARVEMKIETFLI
jgi:hypothetical protein